MKLKKVLMFCSLLVVGTATMTESKSCGKSKDTDNRTSSVIETVQEEINFDLGNDYIILK